MIFGNRGGRFYFFKIEQHILISSSPFDLPFPSTNSYVFIIQFNNHSPALLVNLQPRTYCARVMHSNNVFSFIKYFVCSVWETSNIYEFLNCVSVKSRFSINFCSLIIRIHSLWFSWCRWNIILSSRNLCYRLLLVG